MPARVSSPRFVGRQAELEELTQLFERAGAGGAQLAFIRGESGMGKTRLVDELAHRVRESDGRVLAGECVELGESELPYAPIVDALRPLVRRGDDAFDAIGPGRGELAHLLPELGAPSAMPAGTTPATPQGRLFEALLALLDHLSRDHAVLLVIEDIHWADRSTRDFLVFLSHALCRERVLVVATYRSDELHRRHPLRPALNELERAERAHRLDLAPFTRDELAEQLDGILGDATGDRTALVDRLLARSEGNPLFVEELLAAGRDGRGELPPTLRDALMLRVEALSEDAQELLRVVAAAQRIDHDVLAEASELESRLLRDALREAVAEQLLAPEDDGRYAFRHALLHEAVHDDLLPGERRELHCKLARALERLGDPGDLEVLTETAHHWRVAGDRERALTASVGAARAAEQVHAAGEAAAMLERALELFPQVADAEALAGCDHVDLLRRTARNHNLAGDHPRMKTLLKKALAELDIDSEPLRAAAVLERLGRAQWQTGHGREALESYDRALALLPAGPTPERAAVLAAQATALMLSSRYDDGAERAREAIEAARACGDRASEDYALNTLGVCLTHLGDAEGGIASLRAAMQLAREDGREDDLSRGYVNLSEILFLHGKPREAQRFAHDGFAELSSSRACVWLGLQLSEYDFHLGDWDDAVEHASPPGPRLLGNARVHQLVRLAEVSLARGEHESATAMLEEARDRSRGGLEPQWHGPISALLAQAYRRERRYDDARMVVKDGLDLVLCRPLAVGRLARIASAGVATEADRAEAARALGRDEEADQAIAHARSFLEVARQAAASPRGEGIPMALGHVGDAEAEVLRAEGRPDPALYAAAAERWDGLERVYTAALARRRQAEVLAAQGDRDGAAEAAASARESAERLGAAWLVEELDGLIRRARLRVVSVVEPAEDDDATPADDLGLTAREREVLALLADGRTNREIGETLFMAEKTASVHVSRILAKLDVRSRTEAAAVAHRLGLAA